MAEAAPRRVGTLRWLVILPRYAALMAVLGWIGLATGYYSSPPEDGWGIFVGVHSLFTLVATSGHWQWERRRATS